MSGPRGVPADLPGFTLVRGIGAGGFADVFLYREDRLDRDVAVKILRAEHVSATSLQQFENEAHLMARTSAHPYIVTIYATGVATDGRPYIAMEYYPLDHFGLRARGGALALAEVLRVGVQVASAVETAHRAGILHRDIKPANILTSEYGRPGLTDFGIAGVRLGDKVAAAEGVTLAFACPEVLRDEQAGGTEVADVYSLTATIYTLLAGRSPFYIPGGDNSDLAVLTRALNGNPPALDRPDIPMALNHLLRQGMALDPAHRPQTALALARALQDVEQHLSLVPTPIEVRDANPSNDGDKDLQVADPPLGDPSSRVIDDGEGTRRAMPKVVHPDGEVKNEPSTVERSTPPTFEAVPPTPTAAVASSAPWNTSSPADSMWAAPSPKNEADKYFEENSETVARRPAPPTSAAEPKSKSTNRNIILVAGGAFALVAIVGGFMIFGTKDPVVSAPPPTTDRPPPTLDFVVPDVPSNARAAMSLQGLLTIVIPSAHPGAIDITTTSRVSGPDRNVTYRLLRTDHNGRSWPDGQTFRDAAGTSDPNGNVTITIDSFKPNDLPCFVLYEIVASRMSSPSSDVCATTADPSTTTVSAPTPTEPSTPPKATSTVVAVTVP